VVGFFVRDYFRPRDRAPRPHEHESPVGSSGPACSFRPVIRMSSIRRPFVGEEEHPDVARASANRAGGELLGGRGVRMLGVFGTNRPGTTARPLRSDEIALRAIVTVPRADAATTDHALRSRPGVRTCM